MHVQGNLSIGDTAGTQLAVLYTVEPLYRGHCWDPAGCPVKRDVPKSEVDLYSSMWLGLQTVSLLDRCPVFRVSFIEWFHCVSILSNSYDVMLYGTCAIPFSYVRTGEPQNACTLQTNPSPSSRAPPSRPGSPPPHP